VSALRAAHGVRPSIRLILEAEQNILKGAIVDFVLRHQPRRLLHLARALLQLRDDRILRITHHVSVPSRLSTTPTHPSLTHTATGHTHVAHAKSIKAKLGAVGYKDGSSLLLC
jgi:hypothetical protein